VTFHLGPRLGLALVLAVLVGCRVHRRSSDPETRRGDVAAALGVAATVFMALVVFLDASAAAPPDTSGGAHGSHQTR
jgi:hypothetical protein